MRDYRQRRGEAAGQTQRQEVEGVDTRHDALYQAIAFLAPENT